MKRPRCPCKECISPQRYPGCHTAENCEAWGEYQEEKKVFDEVVRKRVRLEQEYGALYAKRKQL